MGNRQPRNEWVDVVRFWAMLGVFFSHCRFPGWTGEYIRRFSTLAVPLFFASSGYFSAKIDQRHCKKRFLHMCRIVILANVFYFFYDLLELLATRQDLSQFIRDTFTIKNLLVFLLLNESPLRGHLWFLGALAYCSLAHLLWLIGRNRFADNTLSQKAQNRLQMLTMCLLFAANYIGERYLYSIGAADKILIAIRNWLFMGVPFYLLGIFCHRWTEQHLDRKNKVCLWLVILICLFLFALVFTPYHHTLLLYLPTVPVIWCVLFLCGAEKERTPSQFLKMQAAYYRRSGLLFYVLQIAIIRIVDLSVKGIGIDSSLIWQWCRPVLIFGILFLLSGGISKIRYRLVKRPVSV